MTNGLPRQPETMEVAEMRDGRPVFRGSVFGYNGWLAESRLGTIVWTDACPIPNEYLEPPTIPNQCGWGLCYPPRLGATVRRSMYFFTAQTGCELHEMKYEARTVGTGRSTYGDVTLVDVAVALNRFITTEWRSHVKVGEGEVYAESPRHVTEYPEFAYVGVRWNGDRHASGTASHVNALATVKVTPDATTPCDVVAFGDSLTEGMGAPKEGVYPLQLQRLLSAQSGQIRVCNEGVSGSTTATALLRLQEIMNMKPRVVVVAFGANDSLLGIKATEIKHNLISVINALKLSGCSVILAGLKTPEEIIDVPRELKEVGKLYDEVATTTGAMYLPWLLDGVYLQNGFMSADGFHPNENGYRKIAEALAPLVERALGAAMNPTDRQGLAGALPVR